MIGREAPLAFFRRSGLSDPQRMDVVEGAGLRGVRGVLFFVLPLEEAGDPQEFAIGGKSVEQIAQEHRWFPLNLPGLIEHSGTRLEAWSDREGNLLHTLKLAMAEPSWWYGFLYSVVVVIFGVRRIRRRRTPYVTWQTATLMAIQVIPLFILPDIVLPWLGRNGWFEPGHPLALGGGPAFRMLRRRARPRTRLLAGHRLPAGVAAVHLQRFHRTSALGVAGDLLRADVCIDPAHRLALGQGSVLRLAVHLRRAGGNPRRPASPQDAAWSRLEPAQHARPGRAGVCVRLAGPADRGLGAGAGVAAGHVVQERV